MNTHSYIHIHSHVVHLIIEEYKYILIEKLNKSQRALGLLVKLKGSQRAHQSSSLIECKATDI